MKAQEQSHRTVKEKCKSRSLVQKDSRCFSPNSIQSAGVLLGTLVGCLFGKKLWLMICCRCDGLDGPSA